MIRIVQYRYFHIILHVLAWSIVLLFPYFISDAVNRYRIGPLPGGYFTLSGIVHMIIFYTNSLFLYPRLLNKRYWWLYLAAVVVLIVLSVQVKFFILAQWFPYNLPDARAHVLFPSVLVFVVSIFFSIMREKMHTEKRQKEMEATQFAMELKLLRSQISPHFLFNVLTNLVSLARKRSEHLEPSLLMLSGLMRYMLYDAGKKISLQQEADYLKSYVALQELRFGRHVRIAFTTELPEEEAHHRIEPMLLIPFVENAFKHGTGCPVDPFIDIRFFVSNGILTFSVVNKRDHEAAGSKDETSGIGLDNVRSRLALLYPGKHKLTVTTDNHLFRINLTVRLL